MNRKIVILFLVLITLFTVAFFKYSRSTYVPVVNKLKEKETIQSIQAKLAADVSERLMSSLKKKGFKTLPKKLSFLAFKEEQKIEVYGWINHQPKRIKTYPFTAFSGQLGPKLKEGDKQIPEGIYKVKYLNPNSSYYLSIKVSYPNPFDKKKAKADQRTHLGGDIFIHGKAVTIGCIPIGDIAIEELFILAANAPTDQVDIIICPRDFRQNPKFPEIQSITWEKELYTKLTHALLSFTP